MSAFVVGLMGSIGGGKSAAARELARRGAEVIDADALGHAALIDQRGAIVERFGEGVLEDGPREGEARSPVSRKKLGAVVFSDPQKLRDLEAITHPYIQRRAAEQVAASKAALVVLDAALLIEAGWDRLCDRVVFVDAPREVRLERVRARSGWDEAALAKREAAQLPLTEKRQRADHVIDNDSSLEHLGRQVDDLMHRWGLVPAGACPR